MFHADVAKVERNVAMLVHEVASVSSQCFIYFFQTYVAIVFIWMLHMFHTYVACVLFGCCVWSQWFSSVFFKCFKCLQTYVATVVFGYFKSRSGVASLLFPPSATSSLPEPAGHPYELGMGDGCRERELRASGASEGAPYGWMLPAERDVAYVVVGSMGASEW